MSYTHNTLSCGVNHKLKTFIPALWLCDIILTIFYTHASPSLPPPSLPFPLQQEYTGVHSNSHIVFSFSISCDSNFYGSDCATYCVPTDSTQGHYSCDSSTGEKICKSGWTDSDNDCLTRMFYYIGRYLYDYTAELTSVSFGENITVPLSIHQNYSNL